MWYQFENHICKSLKTSKQIFHYFQLAATTFYYYLQLNDSIQNVIQVISITKWQNVLFWWYLNWTVTRPSKYHLPHKTINFTLVCTIKTKTGYEILNSMVCILLIWNSVIYWTNNPFKSLNVLWIYAMHSINKIFMIVINYDF